jgi:CBS domain-containing protein
MGAFALDALAKSLKPITIADGGFILTPNDMPPDLYIIESGKVQVRQVGDVTLIDPPLYDLEAGQSFPLAATAARRPAINVYSAVGDVKCWRLASADFAALLLSSCEFNRFVLDHVAGLLHEARRQIEIQFGQRNSDQQTMNAQLTAFVRPSVLRIPPSTPIREAMETMVKSKVGSVIVADADNIPLGIFTQSDALRRVVIPNHAPTAPIAEVMTAPPATISSHATAYDAMLAMAMHRIRHLVIVDGEDKVVGVVSERDLFAMQRIGLRNVRKVIEGAADMDELSRAANDVRRLCLNMLAQGVNAEKLTQFISGLNDSLTRRVIEIALGDHDFDGIHWSWLAFGSEGRDEQTFSTDQDNGIIFTCPEGTELEPLRQRFLAFAKQVNDGLARCGFPLCKGNIMASNPAWCLSQEEWRECFGKWIRSPEPEALLNATIFFDFRAAVRRRPPGARTAVLVAGTDPRFQGLPALHGRKRREGGAAAGHDPRLRVRQQRRFSAYPGPQGLRHATLRRCGAHHRARPQHPAQQHRRAPARRLDAKAAGRRRHQCGDRGLLLHPATAPAQPARRHRAGGRKPGRSGQAQRNGSPRAQGSLQAGQAPAVAIAT